MGIEGLVLGIGLNAAFAQDTVPSIPETVSEQRYQECPYEGPIPFLESEVPIGPEIEGCPDNNPDSHMHYCPIEQEVRPKISVEEYRGPIWYV